MHLGQENRDRLTSTYYTISSIELVISGNYLDFKEAYISLDINLDLRALIPYRSNT